MSFQLVRTVCAMLCSPTDRRASLKILMILAIRKTCMILPTSPKLVSSSSSRSGRTPVGKQYDTMQKKKWTQERRGKEAAAMRLLDREIRDEAIKEELLTEELVEREKTEAEREEELTQQLVDQLEAEILDEEAACEELFEGIELDDDPYDGYAGYGFPGWGGFSGEPGYAHGSAAVRYEDDPRTGDPFHDPWYDDHDGYYDIELDVDGYDEYGRPIIDRHRKAGGTEKDWKSAKTTDKGKASPKSVSKDLRGKGRNVKGNSRVTSTFDNFDVNDSGYLDYRELRPALKHYGLDVTTEGAKKVLEAYDDVADGKMDRNEFAELVGDIESGDTRFKKKDVVAKQAGHPRSSYAPPPKKSSSSSSSLGKNAKVGTTFSHFDKNSSGFLDYRELRPALKHYGMDVNEEKTKEVLRAYDDTPDGKMDKK